MTDKHYHLIYFAGNTPYATLKLYKGDAIDAVSKYISLIYGSVMDGFDHSMNSRLQYKLHGMELDSALLMEREDPLTVGIKSCDDDNCVNGPLMS